MNAESLRAELNTIFRDIFDDPALEISESMTAKDVEEWDSLNHINLIVAIEKRLKIKFNTKEIMGWQNVGDMMRHILTKI